MSGFGPLKVALTAVLCALGAISDQANAQDRIYAVKGGDTIEVQTVWSVANCKSRLTAAPTVEMLEGPAQIKLWVEPAMVYARRLNCQIAVPGGKLMAKVGTIEEKIETKITFRNIYPTTEGEHQVARTYKITLFPGEEKPGPSEPSRSWKAFLASAGLTNPAEPPHLAPSSNGKSRSVRKIVQRHKLTHTALAASTDMAFPKTTDRGALLAACRNGVYKKYSWDGHDGKRYMERQIWIGMTDTCVARGGEVP